MYTQTKTLGIKVCRLKIGFFSGGKDPKIMKKDVIGVHMNEAQADKYVRKTYGAGYAMLSFANDVVYVTLDIEKIYNEHMEAKA